MITGISSNSMLPRMAMVNQNVAVRTGASEEAKESMSERIAEARSSSAKPANMPSPSHLGNKIDHLA
ncbi:hypothetical protein Desaci_4200 [Desulfosporosinus acidiphilus SJ4]|uniref:Uncharacterized protein n=1 Tax=Desulfosporosinus acidiphilus (strain DSM 22704 / JCM 16185 / SJ4) TaxID=646529 RepID=I4DB85_DESAJ|nr:hypothetical protein [Desulfosporosinus acidiphilus]AFM43059.1 hypothetical protein Desaci_4200 [Desulfosporosinus acidiphilus SJ4]